MSMNASLGSQTMTKQQQFEDLARRLILLEVHKFSIQNFFDTDTKYFNYFDVYIMLFFVFVFKGERKAHYETAQTNIRQNQSIIRQMKQENKT